LSVTDHCLSVTDHCLSVTDHCHSVTDFGRKIGKFSQLEVILSQNHQKTRFFTFDEGGWSKNDSFGLWPVGGQSPDRGCRVEAAPRFRPQAGGYTARWRRSCSFASQRDENHSAQGCEERATLGHHSNGFINPEWVASLGGDDATPLGLGFILVTSTRRSRSSPIRLGSSTLG
jgi:hypothetical protein